MLNPKRCVELEVLTMPIDAVATRIENLAAGGDIATFDADAASHSEPDATVTRATSGHTITISKPPCDIPPLDEQADSLLNWTLSGIEIRESILFAVTDYLVTQHPAIIDGETNTGVSMDATAQSCDLPITDVSRAIANKHLLTGSGLVAYGSFFVGQPDPDGVQSG